MEKREVFGVAGIDDTYCPTEALFIADQHADQKLVAADLLAQAKQDSMEIPILYTDNEHMSKAEQTQLEEQVEKLPRAPVVL